MIGEVALSNNDKVVTKNNYLKYFDSGNVEYQYLIPLGKVSNWYKP